ncbi:MAG: alpha/beta fold hydrolase [Syntrophorhabdaceae bacterium]|nr:alpha/beta fold hydrolase [Syntrophorhabdaceae bacterium]HPH40842.1 alpha/beta fold hydrolase [Syntrophorhabdaceae bacterium]HQG50844.1 alpha/beta fold hydrolase [Syntrophorhabdaceae bacterium]HQI56458.1 alpha/beta fold hydrolase [Syntrophorhabdaceae bacterium]
MSIKRVSIQSAYTVEGVLRENKRDRGVVICHPHPLYGGSMNNNVVDAIEQGFFAKGFTTLRFNFRGVGLSGGYYDEGNGEVDDLVASVEFLKSHLDENAVIVLAGYSFGAWICSRAAQGISNISAMFLVAYPFAFYETTELKRFNKKIFFVGGEHDDISPLDALLKFYREFPVVEKYLKIIPTDHFYWGKDQEITEFIKENI